MLCEWLQAVQQRNACRKDPGYQFAKIHTRVRCHQAGIATLGKEFPGSGNNCLSATFSAVITHREVTMVTRADDICTQFFEIPSKARDPYRYEDQQAKYF
jgi:hypothetical protein